MLAALQLLPKRERDEGNTVGYEARLEKLMKSNAKTRDLDIVISKVTQRNLSGDYDGLLAQLETIRQSSLRPGLSQARGFYGDPKVPVRLKDLSSAGLQKRFDKLSRKYASRMEKRLPKVVSSPQEKEELHRLREDARKLRYIFDLGNRKSLQEQLKMLRSWQKVLGEVHDSDIFIDYLGEREKSRETELLLHDEILVRNRNFEKFRTIIDFPLKLVP